LFQEITSCNRVSKGSNQDTRFQIEIKKEWETFFTFYGEQFGAFVKIASTIKGALLKQHFSENL